MDDKLVFHEYWAAWLLSSNIEFFQYRFTSCLLLPHTVSLPTEKCLLPMDFPQTLESVHKFWSVNLINSLKIREYNLKSNIFQN